jgi:hypothetical protein
MEEQPIEMQTENETPRKQQLKTASFWIVMIASYGFAFALPLIIMFMNPSVEPGFDIIGFFVNMSDEKRLGLTLSLMTIMLGLILYESSKRGH